MFVIVENGNVLLGPMPWRPTMFRNVILEDTGVDFNVPTSNDTNDVVAVNAEIKILPVTDIGNQGGATLNEKIQYSDGPYYTMYADHAEMYYVVTDKPVDRVKAELKAVVSGHRKRYENVNIDATIQGQTVPLYTNRDDRALYLQAYQLGVDNIKWKFEGGVFLTLTNAELGTIVTAVQSHVQDVFDWEFVKGEEIDAKTTLAELDAVQLINTTYETDEVLLGL